MYQRRRSAPTVAPGRPAARPSPSHSTNSVMAVARASTAHALGTATYPSTSRPVTKLSRLRRSWHDSDTLQYDGGGPHLVWAIVSQASEGAGAHPVVALGHARVAVATAAAVRIVDLEQINTARVWYEILTAGSMPPRCSRNLRHWCATRVLCNHPAAKPVRQVRPSACTQSVSKTVTVDTANVTEDAAVGIFVVRVRRVITVHLSGSADCCAHCTH